MGIFDGLWAPTATENALDLASALEHHGRQLKPKPMSSLLASATRITSRNLTGGASAKPGGWQDEAREMMQNQVGELEFIATTLARRAGQASLYVGHVPDSDAPALSPTPVDPGSQADILGLFESSQAARGQIISRLFSNLFTVGDGWVVGIPSSAADNPNDRISPAGADTVTAGDLSWKMLSIYEVTVTNDGKISLNSEGAKAKTYNPDDLFLIRVWNPDPFEWWKATSPVRSELPVLRELVGLTMQTAAQIDSRLAGAGVFIVPETAKEAINSRMQGPDPDDESDPFTEALMEAMLTAIEDRSNASAVVPIVLTVPDDTADKFRHITFGTPLDDNAKDLRDEAIRRIALGLDAPPELLLGTSGVNHWGAWAVSEATVRVHIEPTLALICDALTSQFLRPILVEQGMTESEAAQYVVWYDASHLIERPNRTSDAVSLYREGELSGEALRRESNFAQGDAPEAKTAEQVVLDIVAANPAVVGSPGIPALLEQVASLMAGGATGPTGTAPAASATRANPGPPSTQPN